MHVNGKFVKFLMPELVFEKSRPMYNTRTIYREAHKCNVKVQSLHILDTRIEKGHKLD